MMIKTKTRDEKHFVVKSNALVEARYRLSLQESHVILWLLSQIRAEDEDFKEHRLDIAEFAKMVEVRVDSQYSELRTITKNLIQRAMEIYNSEKKEWLQISWLSSVVYQSTEGCVLLCFDPRLKPYLLQLKEQFTKINISDTLKFKSIYAIRIFELLLQYEPIGKRKTTIEELRKYCGVKENEYREYSDFKVKAINRATTEINDKTIYDVGYREIKQSRKVASLEWTIGKKTAFEKFQQEKAVILQKEFRSESALIEKIMGYGFTKQAAKKLIQSEAEEGIVNAIKSVDIQISRGHVKNAKAMLIKAIQEHYHPEKYKDKQKSSRGTVTK